MQTQLVTAAPRINLSGKKPLLDWDCRQKIPTDFLVESNAELGVLRYFYPELTAIGIVQFTPHVGGYQRAATALGESADSLFAGRQPSTLETSAA